MPTEVNPVDIWVGLSKLEPLKSPVAILNDNANFKHLNSKSVFEAKTEDSVSIKPGEMFMGQSPLPYLKQRPLR